MESDIKFETLFRAVFRMHRNRVIKELEKKGLDQASHPPILFVLRNEKPDAELSQKEISDKLGIRPSTAAISIKRMENAGLLCKVRRQSDLRVNLITLTDKGQKLADESHAVFERVSGEVFGALSAEEQKYLKQIFLHMIENLEKMGEQPPELPADIIAN